MLHDLISCIETYIYIDKSMRIALLGSVSAVIPPNGQAAIERLAYCQAMGLAERGHTILLFAPEGSTIQHKNITVVPVAKNTVLSGEGKEGLLVSPYGASYPLRLEVANVTHVIDELIARKDQYDVILNNLRSESIVWSVAFQLQKPLYHIMHLPLFPELEELAKKYGTKIISISTAQQKANPAVSFAGTVYNAVDTSEFLFNQKPDDYVLYLGSIGPNKNPKDALLAAKAAGVPIHIGGRIKDAAYFEKEIKPLIDGVSVIWLGEITPQEIVKEYQFARAFLFPTLWAEPFGLVAIESMSCGTPVIAYPNGALPEIIKDGVNGYIIEESNKTNTSYKTNRSNLIIQKTGVEGLAEAILKIGEIDRKACRKYVEDHFSIEKMMDGLERVIA